MRGTRIGSLEYFPGESGGAFDNQFFNNLICSHVRKTIDIDFTISEDKKIEMLKEGVLNC